MMVGLKEDSSLLQPAFCFLGGILEVIQLRNRLAWKSVVFRILLVTC